jgi:hypothetical protein
MQCHFLFLRRSIIQMTDSNPTSLARYRELYRDVNADIKHQITTACNLCVISVARKSVRIDFFCSHHYTPCSYHCTSGLEWIPVIKDWRLNERSYGALVGLNKKKCVEEYGKDQVKRWFVCISHRTHIRNIYSLFVVRTYRVVRGNLIGQNTIDLLQQ